MVTLYWDNAFFPFAEEPLLVSVCRWLAQPVPATPVLAKLLEKSWALLRPFTNLAPRTTVTSATATSTSSPQKTQQGVEMFSGIFEKILEAKEVVIEHCMCGQPIPLQDLRFARCMAGHVWPRCCLTFKVLDGTNCRVCTNCSAHALIQDLGSTSKFDWTKSLLHEGFACSFCGGWFEFVW